MVDSSKLWTVFVTIITVFTCNEWRNCWKYFQQNIQDLYSILTTEPTTNVHCAIYATCAAWLIYCYVTNTSPWYFCYAKGMIFYKDANYVSIQITVTEGSFQNTLRIHEEAKRKQHKAILHYLSQCNTQSSIVNGEIATASVSLPSFECQQAQALSPNKDYITDYSVYGDYFEYQDKNIELVLVPKENEWIRITDNIEFLRHQTFQFNAKLTTFTIRTNADKGQEVLLQFITLCEKMYSEVYKERKSKLLELGRNSRPSTSA